MREIADASVNLRMIRHQIMQQNKWNYTAALATSIKPVTRPGYYRCYWRWLDNKPRSFKRIAAAGKRCFFPGKNKVCKAGGKAGLCHLATENPWAYCKSRQHIRLPGKAHP